MRRLDGFKRWLIESVLQAEATMRFSQKFRDKDVNEVPPGFWNWLLNAMQEQPSWTPNIEDDDGRRMNRDQVLQLAQMRADNKKYGGSAPAVTPKPAAAPAAAAKAPQSAAATPPSGSIWYLAKVIDQEHPDYGDHVVLTRTGADWTMMNREGGTSKVLAADIKDTVSSIRDAANKPITDTDPEKLWAMVQSEGPIEEPKPEPAPEAKGGNPHILSPEKLKEEQQKIDARFERMMKGKSQDHMMINALAGTGKTTILKHLAWKYGRPGQKWLYLVFNTKNRVEAEEVKDGFRKFPEWVDVYTTNSFLGHLLGHKKNLTRIPQTELMVKLGKTPGGDGKDGKKEKVREIVDYNPTFQQKILDYGFPAPTVVTPDLLDRNGIPGRDHKFYLAALKGILTSMRSQFKERVLKLNGLLKSFAVDPHKGDLEDQVRRVFNKYDVAVTEEGEEKGFFDTSLEEVKERIAHYKIPFKTYVLKILKQILGYDFMQRNYKDEVIEAATWLLQVSLPHAINQTYVHGYGDAATEFNLGDLRDFNDDLWYSAIFSDQLHWDKYDVVLADEVQDFNAGQLMMLKKLHDAGAKIVAVGDPNQAIYRFRGADNDAFKNLSKLLNDLSSTKEGWEEMSLSRNFRSRPKILQFANDRTHVKNLIPGKEFKDGNEGVVTDKDMHYNDVFEMLKEEHKGKRLKETAFIARTNEPLVHAALKLLGIGVPFIIVGRDVAGDLINHISWVVREQKMKDNVQVKLLRKALVKHEESERDRHEGKATKKNYLSELSDTTLALTASIDNFLGREAGGVYDDYDDDDDYRPRGVKKEPDDPTKTIGAFKKWLEAKLNGFDVQDSEGDLKKFKSRMEKEHPVVLTTAHKSKGLEFSRVFILRADQFPHPKAAHPEEIGQESNAEYVAYTRAMDELHILKLEGQPGYKDD